jgi:predicted AAA+ superfamily ATPase
MLERWITQRLEKSISRNLAVALLGARQVGKTMLSKIVARNMDSIYLDLEDTEDLLKLRDLKTFLASQSEKLVILDEIQRIPDLFMPLRELIDKNRQDS